MKRNIVLAVIMSLALTGAYAAKPAAAKKVEVKKFQPFAVYVDKGNVANHFIPSGYMGDTGDIRIVQGFTDVKFKDNDSIKIIYSGKGSKNENWAGAYWQYPANNWGNEKGFDLTGATELSFWAKGDKGGEVVSEFKVGGITGENSDSDARSLGPVTLTTEWTKYTIDLKGADLSNIIGGFCWAAANKDNPQGFVIYIDEIYYK